jgi:hypothetical protein
MSSVALALTSKSLLKNNDEAEYPFLVIDFNETIYSILILGKTLLLFTMLRDWLSFPVF